MSSKISLTEGVTSAISDIYRTVTRSVTVSVAVVAVSAVLLRLGYATGKEQGKVESLGYRVNTHTEMELEELCRAGFLVANAITTTGKEKLIVANTLTAMSDYETVVFCSVGARFDMVDREDEPKVTVHNFALVEDHYGISPITQEQIDSMVFPFSKTRKLE